MSRLGILLLLTLFCNAAAAQSVAPKNVILIIGDGMGPAHFSAARSLRGADFQVGTMPVIGFSSTPCADRNVTDSGAAATALSIGEKAKYESLGLDGNGATRETVLERAERLGKSTGLVTTSYFFDATPGAFAVHVQNRYKQYADVVQQMVRSGADVIAGSSSDNLGKNDVPTAAQAAAIGGYELVAMIPALRAATSSKVLAVFPPGVDDGDSPAAPLPDLAAAAIERLRKNDRGFFLLIEHEGTDSGSHHNNGDEVTASLTSFDKAVGVALDFARTNGETLVVVTGDHETGGMRITETKSGRFRIEWSTTEHTAVSVPLFAFGPGSQAFGTFAENSDFGKKLLAAIVEPPQPKKPAKRR